MGLPSAVFSLIVEFDTQFLSLQPYPSLIPTAFPHTVVPLTPPRLRQPLRS